MLTKAIPDLRIALIQTDIYWEDIAANLKMLDEKVNIINGDADLIVLPEMFSTGFSMVPDRLAESMDGSAVQWMRKVAAQQKCVVTGSLMIYDEYDGEKKYYNRLVWMKPDGLYEVYDKRHLFSMSDEPKKYTRGSKQLTIDLNGWKIRPMICYDLRFPVWARNAVNDQREADYDVLIYVANWPERRALAWRTLLPARAIENQTYVVGVNRVGREGEDISYAGDSSVIDPLGNILYHKEQEADVAIIKLNYEEMIKGRRQFPFLKDADRFEWK
jgi:omega-amidase